MGRWPALGWLYLLKQHPCTKRRSELESFIGVRFAERHGAKIQHFMPCLLGLEDGSGQLQAVVGIRGADAGGLFLERYLARPIEQEITSSNGRYLLRREIVEVGNLAAVGAGHARWLIVALTDVLLRVQDSGPGVAAELRGKLFEWFFRQGMGQGAGLGLSIAQRAVELHGGSIDFCRPGVGLPLQA